MAKQILIVGGGLAGTIIANGLCRQLRDELASGSVAITMIGASDKHMYQPGLLYVPFGRMRESDLFRDQRKVLDRRVPYLVDPAKNIDVDKKAVTTESGKTYGYDFLVIATGSRIRPDNIPGMTEGGHWFYDLDGARKMRDALAKFEGGKVVVNINVPHKCPVAPLEITFMLRDYLAGRGLLDKSEITYTYPVGRLHTLEPVANWAVPEFQRSGIKSETFFNTKSVDPKAKTITSEEGTTLPYDLLITVPPHSGQQVILELEPRGRRLGAYRARQAAARGLEQRVRGGRHDQPADLQGGIDGPLRGRHDRGQPRLAPERGSLGARLRRQGLLLCGDRPEQRHVRLVQLYHPAEPRPAVADDPLVQARLQPALLVVGARVALGRTR